jgi:hypothetical protein
MDLFSSLRSLRFKLPDIALGYFVVVYLNTGYRNSGLFQNPVDFGQAPGKPVKPDQSPARFFR